MEQTTKKNRPQDIRIGRIKAAVWKETTENGHDRSSVTLAKLYKSKAGEWKTTNSFDRDDLPVLIKVIDQVYTNLLTAQPHDTASTEANHE